METPVWEIDETPEKLLREAAYHGGCARILLRIIQQIPPEAARHLNVAKLGDDLKTFARSGFRWADAYRNTLVRDKVIDA